MRKIVVLSLHILPIVFLIMVYHKVLLCIRQRFSQIWSRIMLLVHYNALQAQSSVVPVDVLLQGDDSPSPPKQNRYASLNFTSSRSKPVIVDCKHDSDEEYVLYGTTGGGGTSKPTSSDYVMSLSSTLPANNDPITLSDHDDEDMDAVTSSTQDHVTSSPHHVSFSSKDHVTTSPKHASSTPQDHVTSVNDCEIIISHSEGTTRKKRRKLLNTPPIVSNWQPAPQQGSGSKSGDTNCTITITSDYDKDNHPNSSTSSSISTSRAKSTCTTGNLSLMKTTCSIVSTASVTSTCSIASTSSVTSTCSITSTSSVMSTCSITSTSLIKSTCSVTSPIKSTSSTSSSAYTSRIWSNNTLRRPPLPSAKAATNNFYSSSNRIYNYMYTYGKKSECHLLSSCIVYLLLHTCESVWYS